MGMSLFCAPVILLAVTLFAGYCYGQNYVSKPNEECYGTWINETAYSTQPQKAETFPEGYKNWDKLSDTNPFEEGTEQITEKWTDSVSNVWYKSLVTITFGITPSSVYKGFDYKAWKCQVLQKISKSSTVREWMWVHVSEFDPNLYPTKVDPTDSAHYCLLYRAKE
jgi:hypothetical protein